jgi:hypothetical protein
MTMRTRFRALVPQPGLRFLLVQVALFGGMAIVAALASFPYAIGLILLGIVVISVPLVGGYAPPSGYGVYRDDLARNEIRQSVERANKRRNTPLLNPYSLAGLPPLLVGVLLAVL